MAALGAALAGCGGSDKPGPGGPDDTVDMNGIALSQDNVVMCASVAAATLAPFPELGRIAVAGAIRDRQGPPAALRPAGVIELGDIGLCESGGSSLTWNDADGSGVLSPGDVATLTLVDCDGSRSGRLALTYREVAAASSAADLDLDVTVEETVDGKSEAGNFLGRFRSELERFPGTPSIASCGSWSTIRTTIPRD